MKHFKLTILCLFLCILTSILTFGITNASLMNKKSSPVNKKEPARDLYSASLSLCQVFEKCGHTISDSTQGTITYSSAEELLRRFPGYEITAGEGEKLVLSASLDNFCPHHYKAILLNEEITITKLCNSEKVTSFKIVGSLLSDNEKSLLEQGVTLDSKKALTSFIEDFTS